MTPPPFPRTPDGKPHAWGLKGKVPAEIWERFSPAYEAQARTVWSAFAALGYDPALEWAGSEDGEAIIGREARPRPRRTASIVVLFHLENPQEAVRLQQAIAGGRLKALIADEIRQSEAEAAHARRQDTRRRRRYRDEF